MKKAARRTLLTLTGIATVIVVGLATTTVVNAVATEAEKGEIESYGQSVTVDGKNMNVLVTGDGPETIVLLPGFGTASPVIDFRPIIPGLAEDHRVVVVEPFGYGLSDGTDKARTTENIVGEVHEALQSLDVDEYILMGHSIAGIYGIEFAERYPAEITAFVGIDSSLPGQPSTDAALPIGLLVTARNLGLMRIITSMNDGGYVPPTYSAEDREQMGMFTNRNTLAPSYVDAMSRLGDIFHEAEGKRFPEDLPLLLFVQKHNETVPEWLDLHEEQASGVTDGTVIPLDGGHYLHHTHATEIVDGFREWEAGRMPTD
ncbi:alpha/beta fold hydrolase [Microbacterium sp. PMB16]|uniref:alpha/beta fold hydrolase n=1 Tax=Microbacterium sp. PMB16 TaxID=3120157 RepID=UPI003F4B9EC5